MRVLSPADLSLIYCDNLSLFGHVLFALPYVTRMSPTVLHSRQLHQLMSASSHLALTQVKHRTAELKDMDLVDRDACRKAGFWGPFMLPSTSLFNDFCDDLVRRYGVAPLVRRGTVDAIRVVPGASGEPCTFTVHLADGQILKAKKVVSSVGPGPTFTGQQLLSLALHISGFTVSL